MTRGLLTIALSLSAVAALADQRVPEKSPPTALVEDPIGVPMRVRDFTFPSYLVLHFAPQPAAPLGRGRLGVEMIASRVNDFQVSPEVRGHLRESRGGVRRPLDEADVAFIVSLPEGEGYYIDGEFSFYEIGLWYGVADRIDIGLGLRYLEFSGGRLDGTIFDFHDTFGFGQQGREVVANDQFQIVIGENGNTQVYVDGAPGGGTGDPSLYLRWALPGELAGWRFNLGTGVKFPVADGMLSSGGFDYGLNLAADRRWRRNAVIVNLSAVDPGKFDGDLDPAVLPSLHLVWLHRFARWPNTRVFLQALAAQHVLRDAVDSALADPQFQLTAGMKWETSLGVIGIGLTENVLNYDNTPDIGLHLSWGYLSR